MTNQVFQPRRQPLPTTHQPGFRLPATRLRCAVMHEGVKGDGAMVHEVFAAEAEVWVNCCHTNFSELLGKGSE